MIIYTSPVFEKKKKILKTIKRRARWNITPVEIT